MENIKRVSMRQAKKNIGVHFVTTNFMAKACATMLTAINMKVKSIGPYLFMLTLAFVALNCRPI